LHKGNDNENFVNDTVVDNPEKIFQVSIMRIYVWWLLVIVLTLVQYGTALSANKGIEGREWQLTEIGGVAVTPLPVGKQPSIMFDAGKKTASGYNGCNNYFGQYELDGQTIKFGPIASTRRACPELQSTIELKFMAALEQTRAWKKEKDILVLLEGAKVLARFAPDKTNSTSPDINSLTIRSTVYTEQPVKLSRGEYRIPAAPGAASEIVVKLTDKRAFGKLNGKDISAVVFTTSTGGTGTYYELALLSKETSGWSNTDTVLLGDRQKVDSIAIETNAIVIKMMTHGPKDPQCCPTQPVKKRYTVQDGRLLPVTKDTAGEQPQLIGPRWQWLQSRYNNDTQAVPTKPENYTIQFQEGGEVNIKADCNLKSGTFTEQDKRLSITIIRTTAAACEPGSLEQAFVRDLVASVVYFFRDNDLYIDLKYDTGTMKFSQRQ
jgi:heat shock protein HslJ